MDSNIYYIPKYEGVTITSNFTEIQKRMNIGMEPKIEYIPIPLADINKYKIRSLGFDKINNDYFQTIKVILSKLSLISVSFHETSVDLSNIIIDVNHLLIGDKSKINLSAKNFKNLKEITFFSIKTFKGKVLDEFDTVKKSVFWDTTKTFSLSEMFPNLEELTINKGNLIELDLRGNKKLKEFDIHYCTKLEQILLNDDLKLEKIFIESCKNLDISNLNSSVISVWPPRKEKTQKKSVKAKSISTSTGNQYLDSLILDLKNNMEGYMRQNNPPYSQSNVDECVSILIDYVIKIFKTETQDEGMKIVKETVLQLNELNEKCDYSLIETNEREQIAEIIIIGGSEMKYNSIEDDITEEWREW